MENYISPELHLQKVIQGELESVKPNRAVYVQQPGSSICFLLSKEAALTDCKLKQKSILSIANKKLSQNK